MSTLARLRQRPAGRGLPPCSWSSRWRCSRSSARRWTASSTTCILALAYVVMALGLNIVVGFAGPARPGLRGLLRVRRSGHRLVRVGLLLGGRRRRGHPHRRQRIRVEPARHPPQLPADRDRRDRHLRDRRRDHRAADAAPARRLHRDRHAGVRRDHRPRRANGDEITICGDNSSRTAASRSRRSTRSTSRSSGEFDSATNLGPTTGACSRLVLVTLFVNFRLRDSRLGRAWIALREDEVAAASMGVPLVRTKLMAYAVGAAFGGISGAFLARSSTASTQTCSSSACRSSSSRWSSSAGSGSIWGVVIGAVALSFVNSR